MMSTVIRCNSLKQRCFLAVFGIAPPRYIVCITIFLHVTAIISIEGASRNDDQPDPSANHSR
jgi:hypothetical protein